MYIVKVLKRKDAASIVVAIIVAMAFTQALYMPLFTLGNRISRIGLSDNGNYGGFGAGWRDQYLSPLIGFALTMIILEILLRLFIWVRPMFVRKKG